MIPSAKSVLVWPTIAAAQAIIAANELRKDVALMARRAKWLSWWISLEIMVKMDSGVWIHFG